MGMPHIQLTADTKEGLGNGARLAGAWGSVSMTNMAELTAWAQTVAEIGAAVLTTLLVLEFLIKKVILPIIAWRKKKRKKRADAE